MNVLVSQVSYFSSVGVLKLLKQLKWDDIQIIGTSYMPLGMTSGSLLVHKFRQSPPIAETKAYLDFMVSICKENSIDITIVADEDELLLLRENSGDISCKLICAEPKILRLLSNKMEASLFMQKTGIAIPKIIRDLCTELPQNRKVIFRGKKSVGSKNIYIVDMGQAQFIENRFNSDTFIQEFIEGQEYTVDVFCDKNGEIKLAVPRRRIDIRNGISYKCIVEKIPPIIDACKLIYQHLKIPGLSNVQFVLRNGEPFFIELNPRFAGTGIASSLASFNILIPFLKHFCNNEELKSFSQYMNYVAWDSIITRFYEETILRNGN